MAVTDPAAGALGALTLKAQLVALPTATVGIWHWLTGCDTPPLPRSSVKLVRVIAT